ncbi:MAG: hypothetical protein ACLQQ4_02010 [Bacteroidia bacterium]
MKPIKQLPIKESVAELEVLYNNASSFLKPRIQMFIILSNTPVITKSEMARRLNVAYNSITKWYELYRDGGVEKLLEVRRGKYRNKNGNGFGPEIFSAIENRHAGEPFQSYVELHEWVRKNYLPGIKYSTFMKYIYIQFGESLKITRILELPVKESMADLQALHARCLPRMKPRIEMLMALRQNGKISRFNLANKINASYGSVIKWSNIYRNGGIEKLVEYKLSLVITPEIFTFIEGQFHENKFENFSALYRKVRKSYLPGLKYYTLHRYVHRHFRSEIEATKAMQMPIRETVKELQDMYSKVSNDRKQRIRMLMLLKANPGYAKKELAHLSGVAIGSIHRWCTLYKQSGLDRMLEIKMRGRKRFELPAEIHSLLEKKYMQNPGINITELYEWFVSIYKQGITYNKLYRYVRVHFASAPKVSYSHRLMENQSFSRVA